jgi:hypothetical protein
MSNPIFDIKQQVTSLTHQTTNVRLKVKELYLTANDKQTKNNITEVLKLLHELQETHENIIKGLDY